MADCSEEHANKWIIVNHTHIVHTFTVYSNCPLELCRKVQVRLLVWPQGYYLSTFSHYSLARGIDYRFIKQVSISSITMLLAQLCLEYGPSTATNALEGSKWRKCYSECTNAPEALDRDRCEQVVLQNFGKRLPASHHISKWKWRLPDSWAPSHQDECNISGLSWHSMHSYIHAHIFEISVYAVHTISWLTDILLSLS